MFHYFAYLYYAIKNYLQPKQLTTIIKYSLPFDIGEIENNNNFAKFKSNDVTLNKVIFALNNLPDKVHTLLFCNSKEVCTKFYSITIKLSSKEIIGLHNNLDTIDDHLHDNNIKYIFIRINIIATQYVINHVNCIIIDKKTKYILFFEPKVEFTFDIKQFTNLFDELVKLPKDYIKLYPKDIGYNYYNRLQSYDAFCQSYVLFAFILVISNSDVETQNYSLMFNTIITANNLGYLLFHISNLLEQDGCEICMQDEIWSFPTNKTKNIFNIMNLFFGTHTQQYLQLQQENYKIENLNIKEIDGGDEDGIIIIDHVQ